MNTYKRWVVQESDLIDLTPMKARELITKCFFEAQKENFAGAAHSLGQAETDQNLWNTVVTGIKATFHEIGADYDHPTKATLGQVVETLARKSAAWGTPKDIIEHHRHQIEQVFGRLR